jgi:type II secretory pathway component GspD/PulD (secretin)
VARAQSPGSPRTRPSLSGSRTQPPGPRGASSSSAASGSSSRASRRGSSTTAGGDQQPGGKPAQEKKDEKPARSSREAGGGTQTIGGGSGGGGGISLQKGSAGGASMKKGGAGAVSVQGTGAYEPIFERDPEYKDLPGDGETLTLEGPMSCFEFIQAINLATNWDIIITEAAKDVQLNFIILEKTPKQAMEILRAHDIHYEYKNESEFLYVMTVDEWLIEEFGDLEFNAYVAKHADVTYLESMLTSLLSSVGRIITDQRTSHIYVWDTQDNQDKMTETLQELDVPLEKRGYTLEHADIASVEGALSALMTQNGSILSDPRTSQVFIWDTPAVLDQIAEALEELDAPLEKREYMIQYARLGDIESTLSSLISPAGSILADPRTGQIFVWDTPTMLAKMTEAVDRLDVPVESQTFSPEHIDVEYLSESLEALLSEQGIIQLDLRTNTLIVTDLPPRVEKIGEMVESLDKKLETRTWIIKYADMDFIADEIEMHIPPEMGEIVLNEDIHQITVTGLPARLDKIEELIATWDKKRQQVLIEAFIVEVSDTVQHEFNINWSYFGQHNKAPVAVHSGSGFNEIATPAGSGETMSVGQLPYRLNAPGNLQLNDAGEIVRPDLTNISGNPVFDSFGGNNLAVTLSYLDQEDKASILSSPRVVVQDSEEAVFENATRVPYVSASTRYNNTTTSSYNYNYNNSNRVEFIDVGTILSVLPRITEDMNILLDISAEDSTFTDKEIKSNDQVSTVPQKTVRRAETQLRVHSGETVVLGGLRKNRSDKAISKTPLLGDIPLLGHLFRNPKRSTSNSTLLIFITTTVVDEFTHPETEDLAEAIDTIAEDTRYNKKNFWGRLKYRITAGLQEFNVSIGQTGAVYAEGNRVALEELREAFFDIAIKAAVTVVLRQHPRAPDEVVTQVMEAALEANLKIEFDRDVPPIVPKIIRDDGEKLESEEIIEGVAGDEPAAGLAEEAAEALK